MIRKQFPWTTARPVCIVVVCCLLLDSCIAFGQMAKQFPSPMVESIREHPRLKQTESQGQASKFRDGILYVPDRWKTSADADRTSVVIAFHCGTWIPALAVDALPSTPPCLMFQWGSGSSRYSQPFAENPGLFQEWLDELESKLHHRFTKVTLVSWSAGYGAIRELLQLPLSQERIESVLLIDGLHASYIDPESEQQPKKISSKSLEPFANFARRAMKREKTLFIAHSEIFPGTYASTTETADWLIRELQLNRTPVLKWGPMKTQQIGETRSGHLEIRAFAGNSAPDHVDLLHALPEFLRDCVHPNPIDKP